MKEEIAKKFFCPSTGKKCKGRDCMMWIITENDASKYDGACLIRSQAYSAIQVHGRMMDGTLKQLSTNNSEDD